MYIKRKPVKINQSGYVFELIDKKTGKQIGILDYTAHFAFNGKDYPCIQRFVINDPNYRNRGYGKLLMDAAKSQFRSEGIDVIYTIPNPEITNDGFIISSEKLIKRYNSYDFVYDQPAHYGLHAYKCCLSKSELRELNSALHLQLLDFKILALNLGFFMGRILNQRFKDS